MVTSGTPNCQLNF